MERILRIGDKGRVLHARDMFADSSNGNLFGFVPGGFDKLVGFEDGGWCLHSFLGWGTRRRPG